MSRGTKNVAHSVVGCWILTVILAVNVRGTDEGTVRTGSPTAKTATKSAVKTALTQFQDLVGGWVGTGQPKRGSAAGAWREKAEWRWKWNPALDQRRRGKKR